jgi:hypothetical protein
MTAWDTVVVSEMGLRIAEGPAKLRVPRQNPPIGSEPPRVIRARGKVIQGVASGWGHPQDLYLSPSQEVSFMHLCVGWQLVIWGFPPRITWERRLKPPGPDLIGGH